MNLHLSVFSQAGKIKCKVFKFTKFSLLLAPGAGQGSMFDNQQVHMPVACGSGLGLGETEGAKTAEIRMSERNIIINQKQGHGFTISYVITSLLFHIEIRFRAMI